MADTKMNIGSPVKDFVNSFIDGLESGLAEKGYVTCPESQAHAKMELHAVATVENSGQGGAKILGIGGELHTLNSDTSLHKMTVFIKKPTDVEREEEKTRLEIAKEQQKHAVALALKELR